jgi:hypothetical protein
VNSLADVVCKNNKNTKEKKVHFLFIMNI